MKWAIFFVLLLGYLPSWADVQTRPAVACVEDIFREITRFDNVVLKEILESFTEISAWPEDHYIFAEKNGDLDFRIESSEGKFQLILHPIYLTSSEIRYTINFYGYMFEDTVQYRDSDGSVEDDFESLSRDFYSIPDNQMDDFMASDMEKILGLIQRRLEYLITRPDLFSEKLKIIH